MVASMSFESEDGQKSHFIEEMIPAPMVRYMTDASFSLMSPGDSLHEMIHAISHFSWSLSGGKTLLCNFRGAGNLLTDIRFVTAT